MKKRIGFPGLGIVLLASVLLFCTNCAGPSGGGTGGGTNAPPVDNWCAQAIEAYKLYQTERALNLREPTEDEVKWANAAALLLTVRCGWRPEPLPAGTRAMPSDKPPADKYGVISVVPPF